MKFHKLLFVSLLFIFFCHHLNAQVHVFAGPQMTTAKYHIRNGKQPTDWKQGYMAGIRLTTQVEGPLYFAPSLFYSQKGYKVIFNRVAVPPDSAAKNNNTTINTIAFAPLLQFNLSKAESHLFVRFGPSIDIAVSGREIFDSTGNKQVERAMLFGSTGYSPATAYANVHVGYENRTGFGVFVHYEHGLSNLNNSDEGPMILQRVIGISVEWKLGRK